MGNINVYGNNVCHPVWSGTWFKGYYEKFPTLKYFSYNEYFDFVTSPLVNSAYVLVGSWCKGLCIDWAGIDSETDEHMTSRGTLFEYLCKYKHLLHSFFWSESPFISGLLLNFQLDCCYWSVTNSCQTFATPWTAACQASLSSTNSQSCSDSCSLSQWYNLTISSLATSFSFCLQLFPVSGSFLCIRWPKYWSFSFNISLSSEYSELVPFRIHWFDLVAVQGTLKSLLQHHNLKASILQFSHFLMVCHTYTLLQEKP